MQFQPFIYSARLIIPTVFLPVSSLFAFLTGTEGFITCKITYLKEFLVEIRIIYHV